MRAPDSDRTVNAKAEVEDFLSHIPPRPPQADPRTRSPVPLPMRRLMTASTMLLVLMGLLAGSLFELARRGIETERIQAGREYADLMGALKRAEARLIGLEAAMDRRGAEAEQLKGSVNDALRLNQEALAALLRGLREFEGARIGLRGYEAELAESRLTAGQADADAGARLAEVEAKLSALRLAAVHLTWYAQGELARGAMDEAQARELKEALAALGIGEAEFRRMREAKASR